MSRSANEKLGQGVTLWFTGLPCSGKSTVAGLVAEQLRGWRAKVELLDGDVVRQNLCQGLGFSKQDRDENIRRIGFVCHLLTRNGVIAISAAISPYRAVREELRGLIGSFLEIHVKCPLEVCIQRDVKGMYRKALAGELAHFTGVSDPYEEPLKPDLVLSTHEETPEESARKVVSLAIASGYLPGKIRAGQRPAELSDGDGLRFVAGVGRGSADAEGQ